MKLFLFSLASMCLFTTTGNTMLPPLYTSIAEYKALLEHPELSKALGSSEQIQDITRQENGFLVTTPKYTLEVKIVPDFSKRIGPAQFHLEFETPKNRAR